jgi:hypothetical protein
MAQAATHSLRRAAELRALGRLDEAEQICDAVLAVEPGAVAQRSGRQG